MAFLPFGMWDVGESFNQAVDLEEEEDEQYETEDCNKRICFKIKCERPRNLQPDIFVIAVGNAATAFIETYVDLPAEHEAEIVSVTSDSMEKKNTKPSCFIYKLNKNLICQCKSYVKSEDCNTWIKQLLVSITPKQVVVLSSAPKSFFIYSNQEIKSSDGDLLRYLKTSSLNVNISTQLLEKGNVIKDLPAAILSYCEVFKIPAVLYINFTESHFVDGFSLKTYQPILKDEPMKQIPQADDSTVVHRLRAFEGIGVADNNLYI